MMKILEKCRKKKNTNDTEEESEFPEVPPVTEANLPEFTAWLTNITNTVAQRKDIMYTLYNVPRELQEELNTDLKKLQRFQRSAADSMSEVMKIKSQLSNVSYRRKAITNKVKQITQRELKDMEFFLEKSSPPLYKTWMNLKTQRQNDSKMEQLLNEVKEKEKGLKIFSTLVIKLIHEKKLREREYSNRQRHGLKNYYPILEESFEEISEDFFESEYDISHTHIDRKHRGRNAEEDLEMVYPPPDRNKLSKMANSNRASAGKFDENIPWGIVNTIFRIPDRYAVASRSF